MTVCAASTGLPWCISRLLSSTNSRWNQRFRDIRRLRRRSRNWFQGVPQTCSVDSIWECVSSRKCVRQRPDAFNYVILMSDGVANVDATDPFRILERTGDSNQENPIRLITVGVGISNYNDFLLEQLAQHGNGWYRYLDTPEQARETFAQEQWLQLSRPFADQARAQVVWNEAAVGQWRLIGYENRVTSAESFVEDRTEFAEIPSDVAVTSLYELELTDAGKRALETSDLELGTVALRWKSADTGESKSLQHAWELGPAVSEDSARAALDQFAAIVALGCRQIRRHRFGAGRPGRPRTSGRPDVAHSAGRSGCHQGRIARRRGD